LVFSEAQELQKHLQKLFCSYCGAGSACQTLKKRHIRETHIKSEIVPTVEDSESDFDDHFGPEMSLSPAESPVSEEKETTTGERERSAIFY